MAQVCPLLSYAGLLRVSLDEVNGRPRLDSVVANIDAQGVHTAENSNSAPSPSTRATGDVPRGGASSQPSLALPDYLAQNPSLWTSVGVFASRLLRRQQAALNQLDAIQCASTAAVTHQQQPHGTRLTAQASTISPKSMSVSFSSPVGASGTGGGGGAAGGVGETARQSGSHVVPSALRYATVLSSTSEDGCVNPMILQPVAEEGCFIQVPSNGLVAHCHAWQGKSRTDATHTAQSAGGRGALPLPDVMHYVSASAARARASPSHAAIAEAITDEGVVYGYAFFLCGEAFCPPRRAQTDASNQHAQDEDEEEEEEADIFTGTTHRNGRRHRARGVVLVLASRVPVLSTLRTIALEVAVCLGRIATHSQRDSAHHARGRLDRFLLQEMVPLVALMQPRGVSTTTMPGHPILLQLPSCDKPVNVRRPGDSLHPYIDLPLHILLCSFSFDALRVLHSLLIQEKRVVVIGCTPQHASACVTSAVALMTPMTWCAPLVPYLPPPTTPPPPHTGLASVSMMNCFGVGGFASQYAFEGSHAEWWLLDAFLSHAPASSSSSSSPDAKASSGFLIGSTPEIIAPLMLRLSALEATTLVPDGVSREAAVLADRVWLVDARTGFVGLAPVDPLVTLQPALPAAVSSPAALSDAGADSSQPARHSQLTSAASRALFSVSAVNRPFAPLELPPSSEKLKNAVKRAITSEKRQAFRVAANAQQERQGEWFAVCAQELARLVRFAARVRRRGRRSGVRRGWPYTVLLDKKAGAHQFALPLVARNRTSSSSSLHMAQSLLQVESVALSMDSFEAIDDGDDEGEDGYEAAVALVTPTSRFGGETSGSDGDSRGNFEESGSEEEEEGSEEDSGSSTTSYSPSGSDDEEEAEVTMTTTGTRSGDPFGATRGDAPTRRQRGENTHVDPRTLSPFASAENDSRLGRDGHLHSSTQNGHSIFVEAGKSRHHHHHRRRRDKNNDGELRVKKSHRLRRPHLRRRASAAGAGCKRSTSSTPAERLRRQSDAWGNGVDTTFVHHALPEHDGQHRLPSFPTISFDGLIEVHAAFLEYNTHRLLGSYRKGLATSHNNSRSLDINAFLPATLGNSVALTEQIRTSAAFRQFMHTLLCVEQLGLSQVLRGDFLLTNVLSSSSSSSSATTLSLKQGKAETPQCANNYYIAFPRMFSLLGLFYERARRRFGELFPSLTNSAAGGGGGGGAVRGSQYIPGDAVRSSVLVVQNVFSGFGGGTEGGSNGGGGGEAASRPLRNVFGDVRTSPGAGYANSHARAVAPALVRAMGVIAGRSGDEQEATVATGGMGTTAAMSYSSNTSGNGGGGVVEYGGTNSSSGSSGGMRRFFSKASKAMKHGLGGSSNTSGHTQTYPLPIFLQCFGSLGTGPVCAYVADRRADQGKDDLFLGAQQQRHVARRIANQQQYAALHTDFSLPDASGHCVAFDYLPTGNTNMGLPVTLYASAPTPQAQSAPTASTAPTLAGGGGMEAEYLRTVASRPSSAMLLSPSDDPIGKCPLFVRQLPVDVVHHFDAYHALLEPTEGTASTGLTAIVSPEGLPSLEKLLQRVGQEGTAPPRLVLPSTDESQYLAQLSALVPADVRVRETASRLYEISLVCPLPPPPRPAQTPPPSAEMTHRRSHNGVRRNGGSGSGGAARTPTAHALPAQSATSAPTQPTVVLAPAPDVFADLFGASPAASTATTTTTAAAATPGWGAFQFTSGAPAGYQAPHASSSTSTAVKPESPKPLLPSPPTTTWDSWWSAGPATSATAAQSSSPQRTETQQVVTPVLATPITGFSSGAPSDFKAQAGRNGGSGEGAPRASAGVVAPAPGSVLDELFAFGGGSGAGRSDGTPTQYGQSMQGSYSNSKKLEDFF